MEPLRIVHVDAEKGFSGGEVQVFLLLEGLRDRGHESLLLCPPGSRAEAEARARRLASRPVRMASDLDVGSVPSLKREIEAWKPDLVHLHTARATWLGGLAAKLAGVPAITTRRMDRKVRRGWKQRLIYGPLVARAVAISPAVAAALRDGGVPDGKIAIVPSAVDPRAAEGTGSSRLELRAALEAAEGSVVLLALASLVRRKGLDVLLAALAKIPEPSVILWIAGDGPERAALEMQAERLGLSARVRFLGRREDAAGLLAASDVLVLPSRREGLGVAALEAMAAQKPVVATRVGGLAEAVVDGRTGLLVEPEDADGLAAAIARLVREPETRAKLGAAGPARLSEGFLAGQMVDAYEKLYREVLAERRRP